MACPTSASHPYAKAVHAKHQPFIAQTKSAGLDLCIDVTVAFKQGSLYNFQYGTRSLRPTCAHGNSRHVVAAIEFLDAA